MLFESNMDDEYVLKWGARIFLIIVAGLLIWWVLRKRDEYEYSGLKRYSFEDGVFGQFTGFFKKSAASSPSKKSSRGGKGTYKMEERCRQIIQKIYGKTFASERPDFLKSPLTNKNLELDCYNPELRIALEYNGQQHYTYVQRFHKSKRDFYAQVHRDDWKRKRCRELGIRLIEVPYWVPEGQLEEYIVGELKKKGCL